MLTATIHRLEAKRNTLDGISETGEPTLWEYADQDGCRQGI